MSADLVTELRQMAATGYAGCAIWAEAADEIERLRTDFNELVSERDALTQKVCEAITQREQLRADAVETVQSWGAYVSEYFQEKHDLKGDIERLRGSGSTRTTEP